MQARGFGLVCLRDEDVTARTQGDSPGLAPACSGADRDKEVEAGLQSVRLNEDGASRFPCLLEKLHCA